MPDRLWLPFWMKAGWNVSGQKNLRRREKKEAFQLQPGSKVVQNDDQRFEVHHDPQLFHWWTYPKLGGHHYIYPKKHLGNGKYLCDILHKGLDGQWKKDEFELPFDNWEPSEKPVIE